MPRIRSIKPKFWDDIKLSKVSRDARLLFIGTWTFADDLGVVIADHVWLKSKIFPYDKLQPDELGKWLQELLTYKFILPITYKEESFFVIRTFDKHQRINKPNNEDIFIDNEQVKLLLEQSRINHGLITEQSLTDIGAIRGGEEGIGEDSIPIKTDIIKEVVINTEDEKIKKNETFEFKIDDSVLNIYKKDYSDLCKINGFSKKVSQDSFKLWKEFVDFIYEKNFTELFNTKFIFPQDFQKLIKENDFPKSVWEKTLKKILATGVKPEHNLYFRIPQFMQYGQQSNGQHKNNSGRVIEAVPEGGFRKR